jgi:hypothetical protein
MDLAREGGSLTLASRNWGAQLRWIPRSLNWPVIAEAAEGVKIYAVQ